MSHNQSQGSHDQRGGGMAQTADILDAMHITVREAAAPAAPGESVKAAIRRASRQLGLPYARAYAHWYRRARSVPAAEWLLAQSLPRREALLRQRAEALAADLHTTLARIEEMQAHAATPLPAMSPRGTAAGLGQAGCGARGTPDGAVEAPGGGGEAPGGSGDAAARGGAGAAAASAGPRGESP